MPCSVAIVVEVAAIVEVKSCRVSDTSWNVSNVGWRVNEGEVGIVENEMDG